MGRLFHHQLIAYKVFQCKSCSTHLATYNDIISKNFNGKTGKCYLFDNCSNVSKCCPETRKLSTGVHEVCDLICSKCKTIVGWYYIKAYNKSQRYKEKKYILELALTRTENTLLNDITD